MFLLKIIESVAHAQQKAVAIPMAQTETMEVVAAFRSMDEMRNTLYGALGLFILRELYAFGKDKIQGTDKRLKRMEKKLDKVVTVLMINAGTPIDFKDDDE